MVYKKCIKREEKLILKQYNNIIMGNLKLKCFQFYFRITN